MKKIFFLLACLLLLATGCATQKTTTSNVACPAYYTGNHTLSLHDALPISHQNNPSCRTMST
jgi:uncharacterized lipoprotein YajG